MAGMIDRPLQNLLGGIQRPAFSELDYARQCRRRSRPTRTRFVVDENDFFGALPRAVGTRTSRSRTRRACRCISSRSWLASTFKVVLTGEGSDELLAGYGKYPRAW